MPNEMRNVRYSMYFLRTGYESVSLQRGVLCHHKMMGMQRDVGYKVNNLDNSMHLGC